MIHLGAPPIIQSDRKLAIYTAALFELTAKPKVTRDEEQAIELLTLLIERYEMEHSSLSLPIQSQCFGEHSVSSLSIRRKEFSLDTRRD